MVWKVVNNSDPGDASHHGGDSTDKIGNTFNGVSNVDTLTINSTTTFQNGKLTIQGHAINRVVKTSAYNIAANDEIIECDCTSGAFTVTLPTAVGITGQIYQIKKIDATPTTSLNANTLTINTTGAQTIDQVGTNIAATQWYLQTRGDELTLYSDGANWKVMTWEAPTAYSFLAAGATLNRWYSNNNSGTVPTTLATTAGTLIATPFIVSRVTTFSKIGINCTTLGAASTARVAIYQDNGNLYPSNLISGSDVGTLATSGTGFLTNTFVTAITLQPGLYWLAFNVSATAPTVSAWAVAQLNPILGNTGANPPVPGVGWSVSLAFGAMPSTFTASGAALVASAPAVFLQSTA
jgi:hypothetical protein